MIQSLTSDELLKLLSVARADSQRNWLFLLMAFWHGLRVSEVLAITPDMLRDGNLTIQRRKGSLRTEQALVAHENPLLDERNAVFDFIRNRPGNQKLFPINRQRADQLIKQYGEAAEIPKSKRHMHVLKHTIAMQSIHSAGIENVRQYLGHKSISSTGAYLKVSDSEAASAVRGAVKI